MNSHRAWPPLVGILLSFAACGDSAQGLSDTTDATDATDTADASDLGSETSDTSLVDTSGDATDATHTDGTSEEVSDTSVSDSADTSDVAPLEAPERVWTWFDQPGSLCNDGTETGFALNRAASDKLLVVFMGGGACWDFTTCYLLNTASTGPIGKAQFDATAASIGVGVLDRADPKNPFRDWSYLFVPYCTGDLHGGEHAQDYTQGGLTRTWQHMGARNVRLLLPRVHATFGDLDELVVSGLSAGGFGASLQYANIRRALDATTTRLVDDSGPLLVVEGINGTLRAKWFTQWRLDLVVDEVCGQGCKADLSLLYTKLATLYPNDRMALLSSVQDSVIAAYLGMLGIAFEIEVRKLALNVLSNQPNFKWFFIAGDTHTMLGNPSAASVGGTDLWTWLTAMVTDDASWTGLAP